MILMRKQLGQEAIGGLPSLSFLCKMENTERVYGWILIAWFEKGNGMICPPD